MKFTEISTKSKQKLTDQDKLAKFNDVMRSNCLDRNNIRDIELIGSNRFDLS
jgi:hypothetical protein